MNQLFDLGLVYLFILIYCFFFLVGHSQFQQNKRRQRNRNRCTEFVGATLLGMRPSRSTEPYIGVIIVTMFFYGKVHCIAFYLNLNI